MSIVTAEHMSSDRADFDSANEYADLGSQSSELEVILSPVSRQDLHDRIGHIKTSIAYAMNKDGTTPAEAFMQTHESFVADETDPMLREFGEVMLSAPAAARAHNLLAELESRASNGTLQPDDREARKEYVRLVCAFNNRLRELVTGELAQDLSKEDRIEPKNIDSWLLTMTSNGEFSRKTASGIQTEIAGESIMRQAGFTDVRHGDIDEDLKGKDLVFSPVGDSRLESVDIKLVTGGTRLPAMIEKGKAYLNIYPAHLDGFEISDKYKQAYVDQVQKVFMGAK